MKILGLIYVAMETSTCSGHNCDFEYGMETSNIPCIFIQTDNGEYYKYMMWTDEQECGSGWCSSSYGSSSMVPIKAIDIPRTFDLTPKGKASELSEYQFDQMYDENDVTHIAFEFSGNGGDAYYPSGHASIYSDHWE